ncbi:MAG: pyrroline-5-carboxylate reductase [bacterium]|nr:pyrroline-5-carboxylate reductase [bacterium]
MVKIALIGCGSLGTSLALGLLRSKQINFDLSLCDHNQFKMDLIAGEFTDKKVQVSLFAKNIAKDADIVILAVKPKDAKLTLTQIKDVLSPQTILVSCLAGISIEAISQVIIKKIPIARAMPNTAVSVAGGTVGLLLGPNCQTERDEARLKEVFGVLGAVRTVKSEESLHAVTALSGSGPAFTLLFLESLIDAGVRAGLSRLEAEFFSKGALRAAMVLVDNVNLPPSELRAQITSPAGVTAEGLYVLERCSFRSAVMDAVKSAKQRSEEINQLE